MNWRDRSACTGTDPELFFVPGQGDAWEQPNHAPQLAEARAVCALCPAEVQAECLADAARVGDNDSIRGGLTPYERDRVKRAAKRKSRAKEQSA